MKSADEDPPSQIGHKVDKNPFFFPGADVSVLLIHGLTGTPYEMRWLGERLAAAGARVRGVKLAGHAGSPEEMATADHDRWYESVVEGFEELRQYSDPNVVVGLSAGAVLAARLAADQREAVSGIAMLAPAFFLPRSTEIALRVVRRLGSLADQLYLHHTGDSDIHDSAARRIHPTTHLFPIKGPINLLDLSGIVRPRLPRVTQPALVIHSKLDHTCPYERNLDYVIKNLGSAEKRAVTLEESFHVITVDSEKETVAAELVSFVEQFRSKSGRRAAG